MANELFVLLGKFLVFYKNSNRNQPQYLRRGSYFLINAFRHRPPNEQDSPQNDKDHYNAYNYLHFPETIQVEMDIRLQLLEEI